MATVTICSDFGAPPKLTLTLFPHLFPMKWWDQMPWSLFSECWVLSQLFHSPLTFIKRLFSSSSLSAIRVVSSAYLRLLIFLPVILIPACASSSPEFLMMYSAYKLNKQVDNIQPMVNRWREFQYWVIYTCIFQLSILSLMGYLFKSWHDLWTWHSLVPVQLECFAKIGSTVKVKVTQSCPTLVSLQSNGL